MQIKIKKYQAAHTSSHLKLYLSRYSSVDVDVGTVCLHNARVYWLSAV